MLVVVAKFQDSGKGFADMLAFQEKKKKVLDDPDIQNLHVSVVVESA